jgi:meiotic recombination protein REC8
MDLDQPPSAPVPWGANAGPPAPVPVKSRKKKNVRLLLDPRTELTNDELRNARDNYVADQMRLRREAERERAKKDAAEQARSLIFAPPSMRKCSRLPLSHLGLMVVIQLKLNP